MRHIKLLLQRLVYVPWLLAAGLALGWAGEAAAQTLTARFEDDAGVARRQRVHVRASLQ